MPAGYLHSRATMLSESPAEMASAPLSSTRRTKLQPQAVSTGRLVAIDVGLGKGFYRHVHEENFPRIARME